MSLLLTIFAWFIAFLACVIVGLIIYATWNYGKLDGLGFPVIKPYLFFGSNYMEPYRVQTELSIERQEKYGMIYGVYDGRTPAICVSDPTIARLIRTVDSDYFRNHGWDFGDDPIISELLDLLKDEKWKTVRAALTPIFTTGKIKQMSKIIKDFGDEYTEHLAKTCVDGKIEKFDMKEFSAPLILESMAKSFLGMEIKDARDPNNIFVKNMTDALLHNVGSDTWINYAMKIFPFLMKLPFMHSIGGLDYFTSVMKSTVETKLKTNAESNDAGNTFAEMFRKVRNGDKEYKSLGITENTVLAQAWEVFAASYLGIRDSLVGLSYELSKNPELQEKIHNAIVNADDENDIPLVTACVKEILRIYISFDKPERLCNRTWKYEGITIPEGTQIVFPTSAIHYNPKYYPEPLVFKPERFLDKENPIDSYLYNAFGQGPRACIGKRFGMEIIRVLFISFVKKFRFVKRLDTEYLKSTGATFSVPIKPVHVDLILR